jgi:nascent polypeptide-associated complex subunit alpha
MNNLDITMEDKNLVEKNNIIVNEKKSRGENRTKKALKNFSFKKLNGFSQVFFQKSSKKIFLIYKPEIYKNLNNNLFLIFGEAKIENKKINNF